METEIILSLWPKFLFSDIWWLENEDFTSTYTKSKHWLTLNKKAKLTIFYIKQSVNAFKIEM